MRKSMVYCCFDANTEGNLPVYNDIKYFNLFKAWGRNPNINFDFFNVHDEHKIPKIYLDHDNEEKIKFYLEKRLNLSDVFVVIIGEHTANLFKYVRWEMEMALEKNIPIIAINISGTNNCDKKYCPAIIRDELVLHVPFDLEKIKKAIDIWPKEYASLSKKGEVGPRILQSQKPF